MNTEIRVAFLFLLAVFEEQSGNLNDSANSLLIYVTKFNEVQCIEENQEQRPK
jgi:hypothetical protein